MSFWVRPSATLLLPTEMTNQSSWMHMESKIFWSTWFLLPAWHKVSENINTEWSCRAIVKSECPEEKADRDVVSYSSSILFWEMYNWDPFGHDIDVNVNELLHNAEWQQNDGLFQQVNVLCYTSNIQKKKKKKLK